MDFFVGTFNTQEIYRLRFTPPSDLRIIGRSDAIGSHSWLSLSPDKHFLYASAWTNPPSIAAYRVLSSGGVELINSKETKSRSGYVTCSKSHVYSAGGATGEVFKIDDGGIGNLVQELSFIDHEKTQTDRSGQSVPHGDFGGLRHGAHSIDLSPDGRALFVADIGRNCIWTYAVSHDVTSERHLSLGVKHISPRSNDGPRHTISHPNGKVLYSVQEHSNMIDVFAIGDDSTSLYHTNGVSILPSSKQPEAYWADEVRLSPGSSPKYLYASTRGLEANTKGYVSGFRLDEDGRIEGNAIDVFETATSGGIANAVEPAPRTHDDQGLDYLALTDSQEGFVFVLSFDGLRIRETARVKLQDTEPRVVQAATAVWL